MKYLMSSLLMLYLGTSTQVYSVEPGPGIGAPMPFSVDQSTPTGGGVSLANNVTGGMPEAHHDVMGTVPSSEIGMEGLESPLPEHSVAMSHDVTGGMPEAPHDAMGTVPSSEIGMEGLESPLPEHSVAMSHDVTGGMPEAPHDVMGTVAPSEIGMEGLKSPLPEPDMTIAKKTMVNRFQERNPEPVIDEKHPQVLAVEQTLQKLEEMVNGNLLTSEPAVKEAGEMLKKIHEGGIPAQYQQKFHELTTKVQIAAGNVHKVN